MQATSIGRLARNRSAAVVAILALVLLAVVVVGAIVINNELDDTQSSIAQPEVAQSANTFENIRFLEENTWQIPYTAPRVLSSEEIAFIESNTIQTPYHAPVMSHEQMRFIEENTLGYHVPLADYQMHGDAHVIHNGCSPEPLDRMQTGCKEY